MTDAASFEAFFTPMLAQAADLSDNGLVLLDGLIPDGSTVGSMPTATVHRLHVAATATYRSSLVCLHAPETSVAAFSLLRGLLEAWSHLTFIADDKQGGNSACRALRYERGAMEEWPDVIRVMPAAFDSATWQLQHDAKLEELEVLWKEHGCSGRSRRQGNVTQTIEALAKTPRMEWILSVWRATSATVHMYGVDFAFDSNGGGTSEIVWALPHYRATWLLYLAAAYGNLTETAASALGADENAMQQFRDSTKALIENVDLRNNASP